MRTAGIDIGSRTIKLAVVENGKLVFSRKVINSYDPLNSTRELLNDVSYDAITATGYGRHMIKEYMNCPVISEIKAFATGANFLHPACRTVLDIGGQDTKAIALDGNGNVNKFEMNDKCAAGTGKFLEIMATALGFTLEDFAQSAISARHWAKINSMCTVFAESEVISLITQGTDRDDVALGIHKAIVSRSITLLNRVSIENDLLFAGGVALNKCVCKLIKKETGKNVIIPHDPQLVGALGCAIHGSLQ